MALNLPLPPHLSARFGTDATGELVVDGSREEFAEASTERLREAVLRRVGEIAASAGRPVQLMVSDEEGDWLLVVHPDGSIGDEEPLPEGAGDEEPAAPVAAAPVAAAPVAASPVASAPASAARAAGAGAGQETPSAPVTLLPRPAPAREAFLYVEHPRPDRA